MGKNWENLKTFMNERLDRPLLGRASLLERSFVEGNAFKIDKALNDRHIDKQEKVLGNIDLKINAARLNIAAKERGLALEKKMLEKIKAKSPSMEADINLQIAEKEQAFREEKERIEKTQIANLEAQKKIQADRRTVFLNEKDRIINEMNTRLQDDIDNIENKLGLNSAKQSELRLRDELIEKKSEVEEYRKEYNEVRADIEELRSMGLKGSALAGLNASLKMAETNLKNADKARSNAEKEWNKVYKRIQTIEHKTQGWHNLKDKLGVMSVTPAETVGARAAREASTVENRKTAKSSEQLTEFKSSKVVADFIESGKILFKDDIVSAEKTKLKDRIIALGYTKIEEADIDMEIDKKIEDYKKKLKAERDAKFGSSYTDEEKLAYLRGEDVELLNKIIRNTMRGSIMATSFDKAEMEKLGYKLKDDTKWNTDFNKDITDYAKNEAKEKRKTLDKADQISNIETINRSILEDYLKSTNFYIKDNDAGLTAHIKSEGFTKLDAKDVEYITTSIVNKFFADDILKRTPGEQKKWLVSSDGYMVSALKAGDIKKDMTGFVEIVKKLEAANFPKYTNKSGKDYWDKVKKDLEDIAKTM